MTHYKMTAQQFNKLIRAMTMAEMYLQDHVGDSDQIQYEQDEMDVQAALKVIDEIIEENSK